MKPPLERLREHALLTRSSAFGGLELLSARFVRHAFVPHSHPEYTVGLIASGTQQFRYRGARHLTPPSGFFVLHPQEAHTGSAADAAGFAYHAFYPTPELMRLALGGLERRAPELPYFTEVIRHDILLSRALEALLEALPTLPPLEAEERVLGWLQSLLERGGHGTRPSAGIEPGAVREVRAFLEAHPERQVTLLELAVRVNLSPTYLARAFARSVGLPPHAYHETLRVRRARVLLEQGLDLSEVAFATGFAHQSHFTERFRRHAGVSPGRYRESLVHKDKIAQDPAGSSG